MENKKGQLWTIAILIGGLIFLVLLIAGMTIGWSVIKTATDEIIPEIKDIGEVSPGANLSEYASMTLDPMDTVIDNIGLLMGLVYIIGIIGLLSFAFIFRSHSNGWVIALFVVSVFLLVMVCILVSNFYEEFYLGQDELGSILRSASLVSYLIIYSPTIMSIISFIAGIILFTGQQEATSYV